MQGIFKQGILALNDALACRFGRKFPHPCSAPNPRHRLRAEAAPGHIGLAAGADSAAMVAQIDIDGVFHGEGETPRAES